MTSGLYPDSKVVKKFEYLEIARGIASLMVVFHHATLDAPFFGNVPIPLMGLFSIKI